MSKSREAHSKMLVNQWENESSSQDQLGHQPGFTKSDEASSMFPSRYEWVPFYALGASLLPQLAVKNLPTTETVEIISHRDVHLAGCHSTQPRGLNKNPHRPIQTRGRTRIVRGTNESSHPGGSREFTETELAVHLKADSRMHEAQSARNPLVEARGFQTAYLWSSHRFAK
jgi:hypothetical protein